jgi:hypothetical protein
MIVARVAALGIAVALVISTLNALPAFAHRPVVVKSGSSMSAPVEISEPEISRAFYGSLEGEPHSYKIVSAVPFELYVNILVPDLDPDGAPIASHDMSFEVCREGGEGAPMFTVSGTESAWSRFYEKYGRDHYYMGPEYDTKADGGVYYVRVFNGTNRGRYALAVGKREKFTFFSLVGAIVRAKSLDRWFFK